MRIYFPCKHTPTHWPRFLLLTPGCRQQPFPQFISLKKTAIVWLWRTWASLPGQNDRYRVSVSRFKHFQADPISWWDTGGQKSVVILAISLDSCRTLVCPVESLFSFSGPRLSVRLSRSFPRCMSLSVRSKKFVAFLRYMQNVHMKAFLKIPKFLKCKWLSGGFTVF